IAGVGDAIPGQGVKNRILRGIKRLSVRELTRRRQAVVGRLKSKGHDIQVVNGGGSGSLVSTGTDPSVTEVTAGSAFYAPGLFHHFQEVLFQPSAFFALQVVRRPADGIVTCLGGGYVASGEAGPNKLPVPVLPPGLSYIGMEGAGEVQTPLKAPSGMVSLFPGDPVFFQHAKAGELCERFNALYLVRDRQIVDRVHTYRGEGHAFL
ncbi:MAG: amino acid deaminase/aldolase, partial [Deltaproteobacteria bacterium]|nr:amino acid deaminase/aldolase [Deltaproteobacteria bacterium]